MSFENVPSFVYALDQYAEVEGVGRVRCMTWPSGGAFYAYRDAADLGVVVTSRATSAGSLTWGCVKGAVAGAPLRHPFEADLGFLYGTTGLSAWRRARTWTARNVCIFADGEVDCSPTGTGVSGRVALAHACGQFASGQPFVIESLIGTRFTGRVAREIAFGRTQPSCRR
ncbi:MAG: proline racemase family protein [Anaerolineae bacterium]